MLPEFIKDFFIDSYTLLAIIGVLSLILYVILYLEKKLNYSRKRVNKLLVIGAISGVITVVFALLFDLLVHYLKSGEVRFGVTFLGGVIPGLICFTLLNYYFNKEERENFKEILGVLARGIILGHMFGRIGCFLAGCCYGVPTDSVFGVVYPDIPYSPRGEIFAKYGEGVAVHPTQIYEALFLLSLFLVLHFVPKLRENSFVIYLFSYGVFRFFIEFIRGDDRGSLIPFLSPSQILSFILIVMGAVVLLYRYYQKKEHKMKKHIWLVLLVLVFALSGCNKVDFTLTKTKYELYVNESADLEYQTKTSNLKIEIKIEDETIASANEITIKGLSAGETKAKVIVNEKEQKQEITIVVSEVPYLRVEPESKNTTREEELTLNLVTNILSPVYTYTSSNPSVASVNNQGVIHTHTYGNALITVREANTNLTVTFEVFVSEAKVLVLEIADYNLLSEYLNSFQEGDILILQGELEFTEELEFSNLTFILRGKLIAPRMTFNNVSLVGEEGSLESEDIKVSGNTTFKNIHSTSNLNIDSGSILLEDSDLGNIYLNNGGISLINKGSLNQIDFTNITSLDDVINIVNYGTIKEANDALILSDLINKDNLTFDNRGEYFTFEEKVYLNKDLLVNGKKRTIYQDGYNLDTVYLSDISSSIQDTLTDFWLLESARKVVISTDNYGLKVSDLNLIKESVLELESLDLGEATLTNNMIASSQFAGLSSLKEIILPNNLNKISSNAFTGTGIEAIRIPGLVKQVEEDAFGNYKAGPVTLFEVHLESLVPKGEEFVYGFSPFTRFFVSAPHVDKYQNEWGQYSVTIPYLDYRKVYYNNYIFREATRYGDYYLSPINFTEIEIVYYAGEVKEDLIPNTYVLEKEYKVTRIGENAFRDTVKNGLAIELVMPDNVREICDYAFNGFGTISKLDLNNVKRVGKYAFQNIDYTFTVIDAPNLTQLWDYAFEGLALVTEINFPNIYHIGEYAISGMRSLERVYAPKLQHLSNGSLVNNDSLVEIVLGPVVECGSFTITAPKKARVWDFTHSEIDFETGLVRVVEPHFGTAWNTNTKAIDTVYCNMDVVEYFRSKLPNATVIGR